MKLCSQGIYENNLGLATIILQIDVLKSEAQDETRDCWTQQDSLPYAWFEYEEIEEWNKHIGLHEMVTALSWKSSQNFTYGRGH